MRARRLSRQTRTKLRQGGQAEVEVQAEEQRPETQAVQQEQAQDVAEPPKKTSASAKKAT